MTSKPFLKPRLIGKRFEGGTIPLEMLADLAVLSEMVIEVAKWKFYEANPDRQRVPRRFTEDFKLSLTGVEHGSAIPVIKLSPIDTLFPEFLGFLQYFESARIAIVGAIGAAQSGKSITQHLPVKLLGYFDRFGRNLNDGEAIEFTEESTQATVELNKESRRKLLLASEAEEVTNTVTLYGTIPEMNQQSKTFHLLLLDGTKVKAPLTVQHTETVTEAFNNYEKSQRLRMEASGRYNRANRLQGIESVEHVSILDPLDIGARIEEFKLLKAGWLDGQGIPPSHDGLNWLATIFDSFFPDNRSLPYLFPTLEGHVLAEWSFQPWSPSLEIDLSTKRGIWHILNLDTDEEDTKELDLTNPEGWKWLAQKISDLVRETE